MLPGADRRWHRGVVCAALIALAVGLTACAKSAGDDGDAGPGELPPGGSETGAGGVPVFWKVLGWGTAMGSVQAVRQTADGGFVGAGYQGAAVHVVKTDGQGTVLWEQHVAMAGGGQARAVVELASGGYLVAGSTNPSATTETPFLLRLGSDGAPLAGWPKSYGGGKRSGASAALALAGGADGFVAAGYRDDGSNRNVWVLRTDAAGVPLWERSDYADFCAAGGEAASALAPVDDGVVVAGATGCFGWAPFLLRVSASDGSETWRRSYETTGEGGVASAVAPIPAGAGFYLAGWRAAPAPAGFGQADALVVRTDADGDELWRVVVGGAEADTFDAVVATTDGGFLAAGSTRSYGGSGVDPAQPWTSDDVLVVHGTGGGATAWRKVKGLRGASDGAAAIALAGDGGFALGGRCSGNPLLAKLDANGDTVSLGPADLTYTIP